MKSFAVLSVIVGAVFASSAVAVPIEERDIECSETCGDYVFGEAQYMQMTDWTTNNVSYFGEDTADYWNSNQALASYPTKASPQNTNTLLFNFQPCNAAGFTQGSSRNTGGSKGAPTEFWGRVVTNVTVPDGPGYPLSMCLAIKPRTNDGAVAQQFEYVKCNDKDNKQWFRLQQGTGGNVVDYFPDKNCTEKGYKYDGQTPYHWSVDNLAQWGDMVRYQYYQTNQSVAFVGQDS